MRIKKCTTEENGTCTCVHGSIPRLLFELLRRDLWTDLTISRTARLMTWFSDLSGREDEQGVLASFGRRCELGSIFHCLFRVKEHAKSTGNLMASSRRWKLRYNGIFCNQSDSATRRKREQLGSLRHQSLCIPCYLCGPSSCRTPNRSSGPSWRHPRLDLYHYSNLSS